MKEISKELLADSAKRRNSQIYEERYRLKHVQSIELHYERDKGRFDYFAPENLIRYDEAFYHINYPIKGSERMKVFMQRVERFIKRVLH